MNEKEFAQITAKQIMSRDVTAINPLEKVTTAEITLIKNNIGGLPVVAKDTNKLLGIITQRDIQLSPASAATVTDISHNCMDRTRINIRFTNSISVANSPVIGFRIGRCKCRAIFFDSVNNNFAFIPCFGRA